ncbi:MAG: hypothetical protein WBD90_22060 [Xanthobacteraceae bacterium]
MFPNVRLIIVAMSASMLAIVCAMSLFLGMFAAFSVTHEPFSTLPSTKPPLQIAFGGESLAPVVDGRPSPFGIRFQLNAPQAPNGPVIVAVPAALDRAALAETRTEVPSNPAANAQANSQSSSQPRSQSMAAMPEDDAAVQSSLRDAPAAAPAAAAPSTELKPSPAKLDEASKDDSTTAITAPAPPVSEPPAAAHAPHHIAPEIKIVAREADNPASVTTSPAPTLARKAIKRRRLAFHLHQSHHFRRPRIYSIATNPASGYVQPNAYIQPGGAAQIGMTGYSQPSANAPPAVSSSKASSSRRRRSSPRP